MPKQLISRIIIFLHWPKQKGVNIINQKQYPPTISALIKSAPATLNLTNEKHLDQTIVTAATILSQYRSVAELHELEKELAADKDNVPLMVHLATKLAKSKCIVTNIQEDIHISVVLAVYQEHNRIRTQAEHPHGENFLLRKISQMQWLFDDTPNFTWDMIVVDDGCPDHSGKIAQEILAEQYDGDNVSVLFLAAAIEQGLPITNPMRSTRDSRKGGSIEYGMWAAAQQQHPNHIVVFTDADLSTHLGQTGLLVDGIINQGKDAAIGSRRENTSIVIKKGTRNTRGKLFIYLWKRIIYSLDYIVDTQCGFKAFTADTARAILTDDLLEKQFAFDIELLLKTELRHKHSIVKVPIAWIDSEAESTTTAMQPYLPMLKKMVKMYRKYLVADAESESFAQFIEGLDEASWMQLLDNIPLQIVDREPNEFAEYHAVTADDLRTAII